MSSAVFGASGFIGKHLLAQLRLAGDQVFAFTSKDAMSIEPASGLPIANFEMPRGLDCVYFLNQSPYYRDAANHLFHVYNANTIAAALIAQKAIQAGAKRFIYASTGNVYAPSFAPFSEESSIRKDDFYALSKVHAEDLLKNLGDKISVVCCRMFGVFGPGQSGMLLQNLAQKIAANQSIFIEANPHNAFDSDGLRVSFLAVQDAVAIMQNLGAMDAAPLVINVAGPTPISIREAANALGEILKKLPKFAKVERLRKQDFIADISLLKSLLAPDFSDFQTSLKSMVNGGAWKFH